MSDERPPFARDLHRKYVRELDSDKNTFEYCATEHLRMSAVYWALMAANLLDAESDMDGDAIVDWVLSCQHSSGGFSGNNGHDPHLLYTLSAVQILAILGALDRVDKENIVEYVVSLQQPDGSFAGDEWLEIDTRFSYCAANCLALLGALNRVRADDAVAFIASCKNFDGGFGSVPGAESHAGQIFCCVAALSIFERLDMVDEDMLGWWLCERQVDSGGLNGRPEKQADVCYSWWVLSVLSILGRVSWISTDRLTRFILDCQDQEDGGIADRPGDVGDIYHTYFGIAGLELMGYLHAAGQPHIGLDPVWALPLPVVRRLGLRAQYRAPCGPEPVRKEDPAGSSGQQESKTGAGASSTTVE